jgi:hypothetical protein
VNIAPILLTWCYIPIIHSLIDLPNIRTVPTWFSYPCSEHSTNTAHLMLHTNHSLTQTYPTFLLYLHGLVILVVNIAPILLTWCYIPIIHSLIDLPNVLTVPTWFSYPCSEHSINITHLMLHTNHSLTQTYSTFLLYLHGLVILVVNIAPILLTWCYMPIIHSLIDLLNILTVPTWFSYPCSEYSTNTAHLMLHTNHSLTHRLTQHSYCTYMA